MRFVNVSLSYDKGMQVYVVLVIMMMSFLLISE